MLTLIKPYGKEKGRKMGLYSCDCGGNIVTRIDSVRDGFTKSCGCLKLANINAINKRKRNE